jgi:hypothetical protein
VVLEVYSYLLLVLLLILVFSFGSLPSGYKGVRSISNYEKDLRSVLIF